MRYTQHSFLLHKLLSQPRNILLHFLPSHILHRTQTFNSTFAFPGIFPNSLYFSFPFHVLYTIHSTHLNILLLKIFLICRLIFFLSYFPNLHIFSYSILHHQKTIYSPPEWDHGCFFTRKPPVPKLDSVHSDFSSNTV